MKSSTIPVFVLLGTFLLCSMTDCGDVQVNQETESSDGQLTTLMDSFSRVVKEFERTKQQIDSMRISGSDREIVRAHVERSRKSVLFVFGINSFKGETSSGTGFIVDPKGLMLTNSHVIEGLDTFVAVRFTSTDTVFMSVKSIYEVNKNLDYAIIQLETENDLEDYLKVSDEDAQQGDKCYALGNPQGILLTLTQGIVSGLHEQNTWIQIDAPVNKGNSGGPLFNENFEVIGMTTYVYNQAEAQNISFALNIEKVPWQQYVNPVDEVKNEPSGVPVTTEVVQPNPNFRDVLRRATVAYFDALLYNDLDFFTSLCAEKLNRVNSLRDISRERIQNAFGKAPVVIEEGIEWEKASYEENEKDSRIRIDNVILIRDYTKSAMVSHIRLFLTINSSGQIISAYHEVINEF